MNLLWPGWLSLLLGIPLLIAGYVWALRRRRRFTVRYSSLSLVRLAGAQPARWRRHVPFALFVVAAASLVGALARPVAVVRVPSNQTRILLALDVSGSMCATDIPPSRIAAAKKAARDFIDRQPAGTQIGIVAFAGFAAIVQEPTDDQDRLHAAIANLNTSRGTAIGDGILTSLEAIAGQDQPAGPAATATATPASLPEGTYAPDIIVVLTDGVSTDGSDPLEAAQQAKDRGIRIYTIGFGTDGGGTNAPGCSFRGGSGGGFGGGGGRRGIDEESLVAIAELTGGEYYAAASAGELNQVFEDLPTHFITTRETFEITVAFTAVGALFALLAMLLALRWNPIA
ncbi:MAG TPA: VWA domain-containing protein [Herpetosiphonaceae bacterium]